MHIHADLVKCQGYGNCVAIDADHFDLDDDGIVVLVNDSYTEAEAGTVDEAVRSCPVAAIWTEKADG